jgi:hypothetical protein
MLNQKLVPGSERKSEDLDPSVVLYPGALTINLGSYDRNGIALFLKRLGHAFDKPSPVRRRKIRICVRQKKDRFFHYSCSQKATNL